MSLTPIHFYAHTFEIDHASTQALDDCSYVNLMNFGQGNSITPEAFNYANPAFVEIKDLMDTFYHSTFISNNISYHFQLRAPPRLNT